MYTTVQKWGNSHAVRIPKILLEEVQLKENDQVEIRVTDGNLAIIPVRKHRTLEERIGEYSAGYRCAEWDTGDPEGREVL